MAYQIRGIKLISFIGLALLAAVFGISHFFGTPGKSILRNGEEVANLPPAGGLDEHPAAGSKDRVGVTATPASKATITPDSAKKRLLEYRSIPDASSRANSMGGVIRELCQAGYDDAAWELITDQAGLVRDAQLKTFFYETKLSRAEVMKLISGLADGGYRGDQHSAISSYVAQFSPEEIKNLIVRDDFRKLSDEIKGKNPIYFQNVMAECFMDPLVESGVSADKQLAMLQIAQSFHAENLIATEQLYRALLGGTSVDAFERWRILKEVIKNSDDFENFDHKDLLQQLVQADAYKAVSLMTESNGQGATSDLSTAIKHWVALDPVEAGKWFQSTQGQLTTGNRNAAAAAFASSAINDGDRGSASQWIDYITDPQIKQDMAGRFKDHFPDK